MSKPKSDLIQIDSPDLCDRCKRNEAESPHGCPYQNDMNGDDDGCYCNCCDECRDDCRTSI